ncbi:MAG: NAD(P)H-binding protein [Actinomycetota bacterium]|nr:NAD(P)H-binding protein [Actinomycetota bacterium]
MTFPVTGATGKAGREVVAHLVGAGHHVRALTCDPARANLPAAVEVVQGDVTSPETLIPALDGVVGVHVLTSVGDDYVTPQSGPELVELFERAGVRRATVLWSGQSGPVEAAFAAGSVPWTHLRPVDFMGNALTWAESIRTSGGVEEAFGDSRGSSVHESDIGAVAAAALTSDGHAGEAYALTGPEVLTPRQRLSIIGATLGCDLEFVELTEARARERWHAAGYSDELIEGLVRWHADPPEAAYAVTSVVEDVLRRKPLTFTEWASSNIGAFTSKR